MTDEELCKALRERRVLSYDTAGNEISQAFNRDGEAAADRIEALVKERDELSDKITAMETGDWSEVKLVRFENGQMDLSAGIIPAIAEYLAQMMQDGAGNYFNFMEVAIEHKAAGPMVLSLQRKNGKTPNQLREEEQARAEAAEAELKEAYFAGWADGSDTTSVTGDPTPDWEKYKHGSQK